MSRGQRGGGGGWVYFVILLVVGGCLAGGRDSSTTRSSYRQPHYKSYDAPTYRSPSTYTPPKTYSSTKTYPTRRGVAENGSYYGEISEATGRPKTVRVRGYYRKDGTYVRGHYRSKPR